MSLQSILTIFVFFSANFVVIFPFQIPIPVPRFLDNALVLICVAIRLIPPRKRTFHNAKAIGRLQNVMNAFKVHHVPANFQTAPLFGVLLLLSSGAIDGNIVRQGVLGADGIQPVDIMALFISLAYLSISLDATGLLRFLAFWVARKGGSSGRKLYLLLYIFFLVSGVIVGNDPVILSGTAFLAYFTRVSGITPPTAWLFAQFSAANMASAVLPPSNPTNLVLTGAFGIPFISYTAHTILPVLGAALAVYPLLLLTFRAPDFIPRNIDLVDIEPPRAAPSSSENQRPEPSALTDRHGAIFGSILFGATLVVLVGTSPLQIPVWQITVPPALLMLARDIWHDRHCWRLPDATGHQGSERSAHLENIELQTGASLASGEHGAPVPVTTPAPRRTAASFLNHVQHTALPTIGTIAPRLPLALLPFALCMFILVQGLAAQGWVAVFARWWGAWVDACARSGAASEIVGAVMLMAAVSTLLCNICGTNIGTTILLARVLKLWLAARDDEGKSIDARTRTGAIFALALGSNFGAFSFSFSASLAGLLWRAILRQKGIHVRQRDFAARNVPLVATAVCAAACILVAEVFVVGK